MENTKAAPFRLEKFKRIKPQTVEMSGASLTRTGHLDDRQTLPLVVQPAAAEVDLVEWAAHNREFVETNLLKYGALLFRNFNLRLLPDFERFAASLCGELFQDNGEHPRRAVGSRVYTPVFYPPAQKILWHNENSFNHRWPLRIWFGCVQPAAQGGETPVVDSRKVYEQIEPSVRERFIEKQVMYVRNYGEGLGLDWQAVFKTAERAEVERICAETRVEFEWKRDGGLRTRAVRPAVIKHPRTGEWCWFTQAQHWHTSCLDPATRRSLYAIYREADLPRACYYGDGTPIEDEVMNGILAVYQKLEASFLWQEGDIMMLDNALAAHARNPFVGERQLLVAMGEMLSYEETE